MRNLHKGFVWDKTELSQGEGCLGIPPISRFSVDGGNGKPAGCRQSQHMPPTPGGKGHALATPQELGTYLGHLVDAKQPGQLQAQHLGAGLGWPVVDSCSPSPAQSSDMAWDACGQPVPGLLPCKRMA